MKFCKWVDKIVNSMRQQMSVFPVSKWPPFKIIEVSDKFLLRISTHIILWYSILMSIVENVLQKLQSMKNIEILKITS